MSTYTYLTSVNSIQKLTEYISASLPDLKNITYDEISRNTDIVFLSSLSSEQKITLDGLMDTYTNPEGATHHRVEQLSSVEMVSDLQAWRTLVSWEEQNKISLICLRSKLEPSPDDYLYNEDFKYSMRVIDTTHNDVVGAEADYTNSEYAMIHINISGVPWDNGNVNLELQVKKYNKGTSIHIFNCNAHLT